MKNVLRIAGKTALYFFIVSVVSVIVFRFIPVPVTPLMLIRCAEQTIHGKELRLYKKWKSIDEISPKLQLAVVASEDQLFLDHHGFDVEAIKDALKFNGKHKRVRGASTISQQTAKNLFLWPSRSWIRKGFEVYFTVLLEVLWSKERIMEVYLNIIEMGDGVYGAEGAAQTYFHISAKQLSASQCAQIAAIVPNPIKYKLSHPTPFIYARQSWILRQMNNLGGELNYTLPK
jgi:monofunctional biosynthetic peptidoglycan transglycosylase